MKKVAFLEKPYTEKERMNFVVYYNHNQGMKLEETETELQAWDYDDEEKLEQKKQYIRSIRNSYLVKYVDPKQLTLVWEELDEQQKQDYSGYRRYLLDFPQQEEWWKKVPLTFEEWKAISE